MVATHDEAQERREDLVALGNRLPGIVRARARSPLLYSLVTLRVSSLVSLKGYAINRKASSRTNQRHVLKSFMNKDDGKRENIPMMMSDTNSYLKLCTSCPQIGELRGISSSRFRNVARIGII